MMNSVRQTALLLGRQVLRPAAACQRASSSSAPDPEANLPPPPKSPNVRTEGPCPVNSWNEWDPLEEVIVGNAPGARYPKLGPDVSSAIRPAQWDWIRKNEGKPIDPEIIEQATKETNEFQKVLELEGVKVRRPESVYWNELGLCKTPDFEEGGYHSACPRDSLAVFGDEILESSMSWRSRYFETRPYKKLLNEYFNAGAKWTLAPKPLMKDDLYDKDYPYTDYDKRRELAATGKFVMTEVEPAFDAADIIRFGKDVFIQISTVSNWKGYEWLKRHLEPKFRVHHLNLLDPCALHIDASLLPLRPGILLANPERPCLQIDFFKKNGWEVVYCPKPIATDATMIYASYWLSMNVLSLDEERVVCYSDEKPLIEVFKKYGFKPIGVDMTAAFNIGGAFHCWTCDIRRKGGMQEYFHKFD